MCAFVGLHYIIVSQCTVHKTKVGLNMSNNSHLFMSRMWKTFF